MTTESDVQIAATGFSSIDPESEIHTSWCSYTIRYLGRRFDEGQFRSSDKDSNPLRTKYIALNYALDRVTELFDIEETDVMAYTDSQLIVDQHQDDYMEEAIRLQNHRDRLRDGLGEFRAASLQMASRDDNQLMRTAYHLAKNAEARGSLDRDLSGSHPHGTA